MTWFLYMISFISYIYIFLLRSYWFFSFILWKLRVKRVHELLVGKQSLSLVDINNVDGVIYAFPVLGQIDFKSHVPMIMLT